MSEKLTFNITGEQTIHCAGCVQRIDTALHRLPGVEKVFANTQTQQVNVTHDPTQATPEDVRERLERMGYDVTQERSTWPPPPAPTGTHEPTNRTRSRISTTPRNCNSRSAG
ncbi:heavy-metal-associated domain-containing protein [Deinococcus peraridilitoris]|uniref:Copper chaperone n=1 Tax=Deinococcus peraridilitoris (strain DSM 19664 / LMG 22246 / CIP 109416 / KR-200) TaxID=937777 RepID=L0A7X3_DEIPD|nr:heavy metal-associated domain-containing protein [Deinococcus peraridilitoris]AFZ69282.1 copper chaperone [Deinococcus peraridilitoris DSM 19664]